jgi:DNA-binding beta-propeller fold protein YncE
MKQLLFLCMVVITAIRPISAQTLQELNAKRIGLPNGWNLTPVGSSLPLGDLPLNLAVAHSKKYMAVTNNGQSTQTLQLIDIKNKKVLHSVEIAKAWLGLCFSKNDDYLYVSGGNDNRIIRFAVKENKLVYADSIVIGKSWPERISIAGIDIDHRTNILYAVTKENNSLYLIDLSSKQI